MAAFDLCLATSCLPKEYPLLQVGRHGITDESHADEDDSDRVEIFGPALSASCKQRDAEDQQEGCGHCVKVIWVRANGVQGQ